MKKRTSSWTLSEIRDELDRIARAGEVFVEGDLCRAAWHPHAETFMRGDDMDYNPEAVVPLKKTMLRLERICPFPCSTTLWRRRPDMPKSGEPLLYGTHSSPYGGGKPANRGYVPPAMTREMQTVFLKGKRAWTVGRCDKHSVSVLLGRGLLVPVADVETPTVIQRFVPVKDSLGDIAAALEVFSVVVPATE